ncbi:hypothetical protein NL676_032535 [Syzygium grande]|nr:hypothetical protein NL676_032535 [Syzygium grande]
MTVHILFTWLALSLLPLLSVKNFNSKSQAATTTTTTKEKKNNPPPGPPPLPIIGNLHQLGHLPRQSLWELSRRYGPVMLIHFGGVPTVVVSSPSAAREVLKTHDLNCCSCPQLVGTVRLSYDYLDIAFVENGDYWRDLRKLCVLELFSNKQARSFRYVRKGRWVGTSDAVDESSRVESMDTFTGLHSRLERSFHNLDVFYKKVIDEHRNANKSNEEEEDIVDLLLKMERDQTELAAVRLKEDNIKAILMDIFLAGVDTSALVMDWTMAELARNPRVIRKAREDIRSCVGNKKYVVEDDLHGLKFLKLVLKEVMRLHPPSVLLIPRETMGHFKLLGYDINPKTRVQVNVLGIGRDPSLWESLEEFAPERFGDSPIDYKGNHFELLTFGVGRRGCPGIPMGMAVVELALANFLHSFDWELPEGMAEKDVSMEEGAGLTVFKKVPLTLLPVKPSHEIDA